MPNRPVAIIIAASPRKRRRLRTPHQSRQAMVRQSDERIDLTVEPDTKVSQDACVAVAFC
jgi:hypothetical protein